MRGGEEDVKELRKESRVLQRAWPDNRWPPQALQGVSWSKEKPHVVVALDLKTCAALSLCVSPLPHHRLPHHHLLESQICSTQG